MARFASWYAATGGNVHLRMALFQAVADDARALTASKAIVAAKLQSSARVVGRWSRDEKDDEVKSALIDRAEQVRSRIPRLKHAGGPPTPRHEIELGRCNAMLGFCYGLLVTECIGALESVGLDYQMGFYHRPRSGRPSLALDMAEELRALTDRFVVSLVRRRQVGRDSFRTVPGGAVYLTDDGRASLIDAWERHKETEVSHRILRQTVGRWALPSVQATLLARHLRGDLPAYPPFVIP